MNSFSRIFALAGSIAALTLTASAEDWPAWGGSDPGRNMYSPAKGLPSSFEPGKFKPNSEEVDLATTKNVKWVAKLGSNTYGNPTVAGGKIFVGTNNATPRDPKYTEDRSCVYALKADTGDFLWQLRTSFGDGKTTEHALIDKAQAGLTVSESEDDSGVRSEWRVSISQAKLATHSQVGQDRVAVSEG